MTIIYRSVKGSDLTPDEVDGNFSDLDGRITGGGANPIDSITIAGNILTFTYTTAAGGGSDSVTIPAVQWNWRGDWLPFTLFAVNDLVTESGRLYLVVVEHTSDATFDPGKQVDSVNVYQLVLDSFGQTRTVALTGTTYTLTALDNLKYFRASDVSGLTVTVPQSSSVDVPVDCEVSFCQRGGNLSFEATTPVTLNVPAGFDASTDHEGAVVTLKKVGTDEWDLFGALSATTA